MPESQLVVVGYQVKLIDEKNPGGKLISRCFHAKSAAEDFAALANKYAKAGARYFVTERVGVE